MSIVTMRFSPFEINAGEFPSRLTIASFTVCSPPDAIAGLHPLPGCLDPGGEQQLVLEIGLCRKPVATVKFNKVEGLAFGLTVGEGSDIVESECHL